MWGSRLAFYAVTVVSYSCKMFITLAKGPYQSYNLIENEIFVSNYLACPKPCGDIIKLFSSSLTFLVIKLECLFMVSIFLA
jgi:hypothetical protein